MRGRSAWLWLAAVATGAAGCFGDVNEQSDLDSPILRITSPRQGDTVFGLVPFQAVAQDAGGIDVVKLFADGTLLLNDFVPPYQTVWNTASVADGPHVLRAEAKDLAGNTSTESIVVVVASGRN
ncbi:MAG: hypothetical protein FJ206_13300 [Gemmatimonadetes bacterium]|nr:hypothetical protein [Gemmatimonadota bacterium]